MGDELNLKETRETPVASPESAIRLARACLTSAKELLGSGSEVTVADDHLEGAAELCRDASEMLRQVLRDRRAG